MVNRPPSHSEMGSTRCCIRQEKQGADDREVGSKSIHRVTGTPVLIHLLSSTQSGGDPGLEDTRLCREPGLRMQNNRSLYNKLWDAWLGRSNNQSLYILLVRSQNDYNCSLLGSLSGPKKELARVSICELSTRHQITSFSLLTLGLGIGTVNSIERDFHRTQQYKYERYKGSYQILS